MCCGVCVRSVCVFVLCGRHHSVVPQPCRARTNNSDAAVGEAVILLHPALPLDSLIVMERGCQQIDSLADGYSDDLRCFFGTGSPEPHEMARPRHQLADEHCGPSLCFVATLSLHVSNTCFPPDLRLLPSFLVFAIPRSRGAFLHSSQVIDYVRAVTMDTHDSLVVDETTKPYVV